MLDHVAPQVFWPIFFGVWLLLAMGVTWLVGRWVDSNNPKRRFEQRDWVAESKRQITHRGFKSRMGAR